MTQYLLELRKTHKSGYLILSNKKPIAFTDKPLKKLANLICQFAKEGKL